MLELEIPPHFNLNLWIIGESGVKTTKQVYGFLWNYIHLKTTTTSTNVTGVLLYDICV